MIDTILAVLLAANLGFGIWQILLERRRRARTQIANSLQVTVDVDTTEALKKIAQVKSAALDAAMAMGRLK